MATFSYSGFGIRNSGFGIWLFRPLRLELLRLEPRHFYSRTYRTNETNFGSSKHYMRMLCDTIDRVERAIFITNFILRTYDVSFIF